MASDDPTPLQASFSRSAPPLAAPLLACAAQPLSCSAETHAFSIFSRPFLDAQAGTGTATSGPFFRFVFFFVLRKPSGCMALQCAWAAAGQLRAEFDIARRSRKPPANHRFAPRHLLHAWRDLRCLEPTRASLRDHKCHRGSIRLRLSPPPRFVLCSPSPDACVSRPGPLSSRLAAACSSSCPIWISPGPALP